MGLSGCYCCLVTAWNWTGARSLARPVLSCTHFFQAPSPATQASYQGVSHHYWCQTSQIIQYFFKRASSPPPLPRPHTYTLFPENVRGKSPQPSSFEAANQLHPQLWKKFPSPTPHETEMHLVSLTGLPHILPSPCTTFSKSLSVNLHFHVDHVAQNAFNTRNNEA